MEGQKELEEKERRKKFREYIYGKEHVLYGAEDGGVVDGKANDGVEAKKDDQDQLVEIRPQFPSVLPPDQPLVADTYEYYDFNIFDSFF